ncbi:hypothetical protein QBC34DRAFT_401532 [Podospora aff. communis PSN243]|uniref:Ecp2 effector protein-like domain-containing protein n=1 Tax=Podospora aff. communis PSN243 TaxID=3040156 RepID=A0AAV9GU86_9PEZI|nr:hypothetical protein QBC34DRAFT_401532 [Podospora aff. communis PSN243]
MAFFNHRRRYLVRASISKGILSFKNDTRRFSSAWWRDRDIKWAIDSSPDAVSSSSPLSYPASISCQQTSLYNFDNDLITSLFHHRHKFTSLAAALISLATSANCAPAAAPVTVREDHPSKLFDRGMNNRLCGDITQSWGETSGASPLVDDCFRMIDTQTAPYHTLVSFEPRKHLLRYGTCVFAAALLTFSTGATEPGGIPLPYGGIGDEDIRVIVRKAVENHRDGAKIGALGHMVCDDEGLIEWAIHHS